MMSKQIYDRRARQHRFAHRFMAIAPSLTSTHPCVSSSSYTQCHGPRYILTRLPFLTLRKFRFADSVTWPYLPGGYDQGDNREVFVERPRGLTFDRLLEHPKWI